MKTYLKFIVGLLIGAIVGALAISLIFHYLPKEEIEAFKQKSQQAMKEELIAKTQIAIEKGEKEPTNVV